MSGSRTRSMLLAAATIFTIASWVGSARAVDYCVYSVISGFNDLPELDGGVIICVTCPASNKCPGPGGINFTARIRNGSGTESDGMLRKLEANCTACPSQGKTGYSFVNVPKVGLLEDDIDWTTTSGIVRFSMRFRNTAEELSDPTHAEVFVQDHYGAYVANGPMIWSGELPPIQPNSFFDVLFEVPLSQLPPSPTHVIRSAPADGASLNDPCGPGGPGGPGAAWQGNIDVVWSEPGGGGNVNKHTAGIGLFPGGAAHFVHLLTGCAGPITWSFGPVCPGFALSLLNEDFTPAPASLPPGWTGWIGASAAASVPGGTTCCFKLDVVCEFEVARIDLCAKACSEPTQAKRKRWAEVKAFYR